MTGPDPLLNARVGDEIVYDEASYFYQRRTPGNRIMAVSEHGAMLEMPDPDTGFPAMPTVSGIVAAMAAWRLFLRSDPLANPVRAEARARSEATADLVTHADDGTAGWAEPTAGLRDLVVRAWDRLSEEERPNLTDDGLRNWLGERIGADRAISIYGRIPAGSTIREWIRERGARNDRRACDMVSRRGRVARKRRVPELVLEIARLHALAQAGSRRKAKVQFRRFEKDVERANGGKRIVVAGKELTYQRPLQRLKACGLTTFQLECRRANSMIATQAKFGTGGRDALHGGGGGYEEPVRYLEAVEQDDTPFPKWFVVDPHNRIPVGVPTAVLSLEIYCRAVLGWDVSFENPSSSTWMRALAHCGIPKTVPDFLAADFPELAGVYGYVRGYVLYDNALQNIARAVEDAGGELAHEHRVAGEGQATHKSHVERALKTIMGYMDEVPGMVLDIPLARKFGYDASKHVMITVDEFRRIFANAVATYNTQPSEALGGRSPLQVWEEQRALWGRDEAKDVDQFIRSIGDVHEVQLDRTGFVANELPYSLGTLGNEQLLADFAAAHGVIGETTTPKFPARVKTYDTVGTASILNPLTSRYVEVPCTRRRYAQDLPLWLHRLVLRFIRESGRAFRTDDQMADAREAFSASIEAAVPEASARERRTYASMIDAPNVQRFIGTHLVRRLVDASPSGLSDDSVKHVGRVGSRKDDALATPRSRRGGRNASKQAAIARAEEKMVRDTVLRDAAAHAAASKPAGGRRTIKPMQPGGFGRPN